MAETEKRQPEARMQQVSRREFFNRVAAAGTTAVVAGGLGIALHNRQPSAGQAALRLKDYRVAPPDGRPLIVAARGESVDRMLETCLDRVGGISHYIKPGDKVVLKPNAGFASPPNIAATTHPEVVGAVARMCLAAGAASVTVVDNSINDPQRCMRISGIAAAATAAGASVMYPMPSAFREVEEPGNKVLKRWPFFFAPFVDATKVIGLPIAKHHMLAGASLGMKNWYGLLGGRRNRLHQDINTSLADLGTLVRPTLVVLDATRVLFRNGPTGGSMSDVRQDGILAVAADPVALDTYGASLLGREPEELPYIVEAERRGLGTTDLKKAGFEMLTRSPAGGH